MSKKQYEPPAAVGLTPLIEQLRAELAQLSRSVDQQAVSFEVGDVELELQIGITTEKSGGAKVAFWVLELGADVGKQQTHVQRIKLTLKPRLNPNGGARSAVLKVSD